MRNKFYVGISRAFPINLAFSLVSIPIALILLALGILAILLFFFSKLVLLIPIILAFFGIANFTAYIFKKNEFTSEDEHQKRGKRVSLTSLFIMILSFIAFRSYNPVLNTNTTAVVAAEKKSFLFGLTNLKAAFPRVDLSGYGPVIPEIGMSAYYTSKNPNNVGVHIYSHDGRFKEVEIQLSFNYDKVTNAATLNGVQNLFPNEIYMGVVDVLTSEGEEIQKEFHSGDSFIFISYDPERKALDLKTSFESRRSEIAHHIEGKLLKKIAKSYDTKQFHGRSYLDRININHAREITFRIHLFSTFKQENQIEREKIIRGISDLLAKDFENNRLGYINTLFIVEDNEIAGYNKDGNIWFGEL